MEDISKKTRGKEMIAQDVKDKLDLLPDNLKKEVLDYVDFLLQKHNIQPGKKQFNFDWAGGLVELKSKVTAVELQHKALEWR
ncbi:MAG: DUF2281 domain-containing protein [Anaerolineae bacterium]